MSAEGQRHRDDDTEGEALLTFSDGKAPVTKLKEVNQAMAELIGLDMKQFTQIAMIAQGDFRKLLLADTERGAISFRKLFHTDLYKTIQEKLKFEAVVWIRRIRSC